MSHPLGAQPPPDPLAWDEAAGAITAELAAALIASATIDDIGRVVLTSAIQLTGSACGLVGYIEPDTGRLVAPALTRDACLMADKHAEFKAFTGLWNWVLTRRQPLMTNAPGADPRSEGVPAGHIAIERFLCVPAQTGDTLMGLIGLANPGRDYTPRDLVAVERLATVYALALQRLRAETSLRTSRDQLETAVLERTAQLQQANDDLSREIAARRQAEQAEREQRALAESLRDTATLLTSTLNLDEVLERVLGNAGRVAPHDAANIMLVDAATGIARVARDAGYAALGLRDAVRSLRFPVDSVPAFKRMARAGEPEVCSDNRDDPEWVDLLGRRWLRAWVAAPVRIKDRTVGFLNLDSATPGFFTREHARRLQAFANQAAIAIENAQLYQKLSASEQAYRALVETSPDAIVLAGLDGAITLCNRQAAALHGYDSAVEMIGMNYFDLVAPEDREQVMANADNLLGGAVLRDQEFQILRRNGARAYASISATILPGPDGIPQAYIGVIRDIEGRKQAEEQLRYISTHDALTGLFNRAYFETEMARLEPGRRFPVSIVVADVNELKLVNDTLGHAAGDALLQKVALLMRSAFRAEDMVARIGGDEFCVILPDAPAPVAQITIRRLRAVLANYNARPGVTTISISIGAATALQHERLISAFRLADSRMYQDKAAAKGGSPHAAPLA